MGFEGTARPGARASRAHPSPAARPAVNCRYASETGVAAHRPGRRRRAGACWPCTAARRSAPPGSCSPPSAPTSSATASTAASSPTGCSSLNDRRATPAERLANGRDFVPTTRWVLFGHHFAAIAGAGPLVGPVLAAQFGYLPGTIWIVFGVVLGGRGAGFRDPVRLDAPRRQVARPDGQGGDRPGDRRPRHGGRARDHGHPARRAGARRGQRAQGQPVGRVHHSLHDPDRPADGLLDEGVASGPDARGLGGRRGAAAAGAGGRTLRGGLASARAAVHLVGPHASPTPSSATGSWRACCRSGCCSARATTSRPS